MLLLHIWLLFFPLDKSRFGTHCRDKSWFLPNPRAMLVRLDSARQIRRKLSVQFVRYISRTVQPCLHPLAIPTASLFATTSRTPTRLSAERTRRSGRSNLPFLPLVRAAAIATTWDARAQPASTTGTRGAQVVTDRQYEARSRGERYLRSRGRIPFTFIASSLRAQLVIDSHFRHGSTPSDTRRFVKVTRSRT